MAELPDPTDALAADDRAQYDRMAAARAHSDGRAALGEVYVRLFNNPDVAVAVGALGEHLRFHGVLPDATRELVILRYAARSRFGYEWAHHQRPARLAGLPEAVIEQLLEAGIPAELPEADWAAVAAVDAIVEHRSIPDEVQHRIVEAHGTAGVVEIAVLCGLYAIMGYTVTAFDIPLEAGLPTPPF